MLKKVISLILVFALLLQLAFPVFVVNAEDVETSEATDAMLHEFESEEDVEDLADEVILVDDSEIAENLIQIKNIFPDPVLAGVIAETLELTVESYILIENLADIIQLSAGTEGLTNFGVRSLEGIQHLINVESLFFGNNDISDLTPLSNLVNLKGLSLQENQILDISPLSNLTQLTHLTIWDNQISDITALSELTNLVFLSLGGNQINDISSLTELANLVFLDLGSNRITDLRPLNDLNLQEVNLRDQTIVLSPVHHREGTRIEFFLPDGRRVERLGGDDEFTYVNGILIWESIGMRSFYFNVTTPFPFSVHGIQEVMETRFPRTSIDAMDAFLLNHGERQNPFVIPTGLTLNEALNEMDWGSGVTIRSFEPRGGGWQGGSIYLVLDEQPDGSHSNIYHFGNRGLFIVFEDRRIPQTSIDLMYAFIESNTEENPFVIPYGSTFYEAINALNWGEGITVWTPMSGLVLPVGTICGSLILVLSDQSYDGKEMTDETYLFETCLFIEYEVENSIRPTLPQTGISLGINTMLAGAGLLGASIGVVIYKKIKRD